MLIGVAQVPRSEGDDRGQHAGDRGRDDDEIERDHLIVEQVEDAQQADRAERLFRRRMRTEAATSIEPHDLACAEPAREDQWIGA